MQWIKWIHKFLSLFDNSDVEVKQNKHSPNRVECINVLLELDVMEFKKYQPNIGLTRNIFTRYGSISEYDSKVRKTILILKQGKAIKPDWDSVNEVEMSLDRFFVSEDGFYIDIEKSVKRFKESCMELCETLSLSDNAEHGIHEHNLRMLTKLLINIREVTKVLVSASKEC